MRIASNAEAFSAGVCPRRVGRPDTAGHRAAYRRRRRTAGAAGSIACFPFLIGEALGAHAAKEQRWDAQLRRVYRRTRSHSARIIITRRDAVSAGIPHQCLVVIAEPLREDRAPAAADAIVAAGGVGESGRLAAVSRSGSSRRSISIGPATPTG